MLEIGIAIRRRFRDRIEERGILLLQSELNGFTRLRSTTPEADHSADVAVQLVDLGAAGSLVESVDVLGHERAQLLHRFQ